MRPRPDPGAPPIFVPGAPERRRARLTAEFSCLLFRDEEGIDHIFVGIRRDSASRTGNRNDRPTAVQFRSPVPGTSIQYHNHRIHDQVDHILLLFHAGSNSGEFSPAATEAEPGAPASKTTGAMIRTNPVISLARQPMRRELALRIKIGNIRSTAAQKEEHTVLWDNSAGTGTCRKACLRMDQGVIFHLQGIADCPESVLPDQMRS